MKYIISLSLLITLSACSSTPKTGVDHAGEERVLSRIDDLSSRPDWVKESEPFRIENGKVLSLGMTSIPGDNNVSAAYRIASNNGKGLIAGAISSRLDFIFQSAEEGTALDANSSKYIGAEASKLTTSSLRQTKQYWEKVQIIQENGQPTIRYKVFALVEILENDFKSAILEEIRKVQGKGGISSDFAKKVDAHWSEFVGAPGKDTK